MKLSPLWAKHHLMGSKCFWIVLSRLGLRRLFGERESTFTGGTVGG